jgi:hypothetical protein
MIKLMYFIQTILLLFIPVTMIAQEPLSPDWSTPTPVPDNGGSATGNVGNNTAILSTGKIILVYNETNTNGGVKLHRTISDDDGKSWSAPVDFPADDGLIGACCITMAVDANDVLHAIFTARAPEAGLYYTKTTDGGSTWNAAKRISASIRYKIAYNFISTDRQGQLHVFWHDGDTDDDNTPAEVWYARSTDDGNNWEAPRMLSNDDGEHSAFPRADFGPTDSDTLLVAWRDARPAGNDWDIYGAVTYDGGATWSEELIAGGPDRQWDPMVQMDRHGTIHLGVMEYPASRQIDVFVWYSQSTDGGASWSARQTMRGARTIFPVFSYDPAQDILWYFLRLESPPGPNPISDLGVRYSLDNGISWSEVERLTMLESGGTKFPAFATGTDGIPRIVYSLKDSNGNDKLYFQKRKNVPVLTGVNETNTPAPGVFVLAQNYPNPFNPSTTIRFSLPQADNVELTVTDILGREIATLVQGRLPAGPHSVRFEAMDLPAGLYFYRLVAGDFRQVRTAILVK